MLYCDILGPYTEHNDFFFGKVGKKVTVSFHEASKRTNEEGSFKMGVVGSETEDNSATLQGLLDQDSWFSSDSGSFVPMVENKIPTRNYNSAVAYSYDCFMPNFIFRKHLIMV